MPPGSTRPQRPARCQSSSVSRTSRRGWEVIARCTSRSAARVQARESSAREICGQGLTRSANASSSSARRVGTSACHADSRSSRSSARAASGCSTSPSPTISVAVRSPTRTSTVSAPSITSTPGPVADLGEAAREIAVAGRRRRTPRRSRPAAPPGASAGRARRRDRRRGRAGSGTTRSAARPCSRARASAATARSRSPDAPGELRCRAPRELVDGRRPSASLRRRSVILRLVAQRDRQVITITKPFAGVPCNRDYAASTDLSAPAAR